jgi:DNA-binding winged helix-turn-helix (wHTH) protein
MLNLVGDGGWILALPGCPRTRNSFGDCEISLERRELWRAKRALHVEPQVFDLYLVQNHDRVVSKEDPIASVWGGRIVSESTLTSPRVALRLSPRDPFSAPDYGIAAFARFIGHHYDEAIHLSHEAIRQRGVGGRRVLTAAAGMAGRHDVATAALQKLRRARPISRSPG